MFHPGPVPQGPPHLPPVAMAVFMLLPIAAIITPFIFTYFVIKLKNARDALLIEKGLYKRPTLRDRFRQFYLTGIIITVLGLGFFVGTFPIGFLKHVRAEGFPFFGPWLFPGIILTFLGAGFLVFARTAFRREELNQSEHDVKN